MAARVVQAYAANKRSSIVSPELYRNANIELLSVVTGKSNNASRRQMEKINVCATCISQRAKRRKLNFIQNNIYSATYMNECVVVVVLTLFVRFQVTAMLSF
jgi:hypothetical protein